MKRSKTFAVASLGAALAGVSTWAAAAFPIPSPYGPEPIGMAVVGLALVAFGVWRWGKITGG